MKFIEEQTFRQQDFRIEPLMEGEYESCVFKNCQLGGADLSGYKFFNCSFVDCDLSNAKLEHTSFNEAVFRGCKMLGLHFDACNDFGLALAFEECCLNHSVFYKKSLRETVFKQTELKEVDFSECDLTGSLFDACDLSGAIFSFTNLEKVGFSSSWNYSINPEQNRMKKAVFSLSGLPGLLDAYDLEIDG